MVSIQLVGGLANQMFQTAFILAYAMKHRLGYCVPTTVVNPHVPSKPAYRFPGVQYSEHPPELSYVYENHFHYEVLGKMDNACFFGYWQSWKYFDEYRDQILKAFGFEWKPKPNMCSIHVRRTDYLKWADHHPPITEEYLSEAIKKIIEMTDGKVKFKFFSDDISYCKQFAEKLFFFSPSAVEFSEGTNEVEDMAEASGCRFNIGSNSAYSWWIHYINQSKNKVGIFPATWFGPALQHDLKDLYLPGTIIL